MKHNDFELPGMKYHYLTELYDRKICRERSPRDGNALPVTAEERALSNEYARQILAEIKKENSWMTSEDIRHSIRDAAHYKFEYLREIFGDVESPVLS